jgi:antitoxin (DNA-binding transcriptional repressor) of toxin-antitoxin stability system
MTRIPVTAAQTELLELARRAAEGEDIVLEESGQPLARIVPFDDVPRRPGRLKGKVRLAPDFDAPLPEAMVRAFVGDSE